MHELPFSDVTAAWFRQAFEAPTPAQRAAWPAIARGEHTLLVAPTGSGKTLAAFLCAIDRLLTPRPADHAPGVRVLYVSPLKALAVDVERNLRAPLVGVQRHAAARGIVLPSVRVDVRTGDTPAAARRAFQRDPGEILVTTPESLYLLLTSSAAALLRQVEVVILDEVHVLAPSKRGAHLQLSLERLAEGCAVDPQRVGLSATVRPLSEAARFLGGDRPVTLADASDRPRLDLEVRVPVDDMRNPPSPTSFDPEAPGYAAVSDAAHAYPTNQPRGGIWPVLHPVLLEEIRAHRSTLVFTNSRLLCERLCRGLNEVAGAELVTAHHGSVSHERRAAIEEALKAGTVPALVATSSLELGIDMGAIDLVLLVASPGSVASGLQRVGRAGHQVGAVSVGRIYPKHPADLLEAAVVGARMIEGRIEALRVPRLPLDVLAQQVVAAVAAGPVAVDALLRTFRRAASFTELSRAALDRVLQMLAGQPSASNLLADLPQLLTWDRATDTLAPRKGTRLTAVLNGGTIPDRGLFRVRLGEGGPRLGELDEEMVYESRVGDHVVLGASTWRLDAIGRDEVVVSPAPGRPGRLAFWKGESPGRPVELGQAVGAFLREIEPALRDGAAAEAWARQAAPLDARAARNLVGWLSEQLDATGVLPTDRCVVVERFRDELGDWRVCVLCPLGVKVLAPWALAIEAMLAARTGVQVQAMASDDGLCLRLADGDEPPSVDLLLPDPDELQELVLDAVRSSSLFAGRFRECAARALLTPRRSATGRRPLWLQRQRAEALLAAVSSDGGFPILLEVYREILDDVFDMAALRDLLRGLRDRSIRLHEAETRRASPFARGLAFQYVAAYMYEGDAPLAERRALALGLDRDLLAELLGHDGLRELLDADAIADVERELQGLSEGAQAPSDLDGAARVLRRLGDLTAEELAARVALPGAASALLTARRAVELRVGGEARLVAVEEVAVWRDALGVVLPGWLPVALLDPVPRPVEQLLRRYARTHGPFTAAEVAARYGWTAAQVEVGLRALLAEGHVVTGELRPGGAGVEWCDAEVLRRIKRRSLARLRAEVEAVDVPSLQAFTAAWHGIPGAAAGPARLGEVVRQLEAAPLLWSEVEASVLPARLAGFQPVQLDQQGALGELTWQGAGAVGPRDGHVCLLRREHLHLLGRPPAASPAWGPLHDALLARLRERGASFTTELLALGPAREVTEALADLAWAGAVTNDTFAPLRGFVANTRPSSLAGGRWSLVPAPSADAHAAAVALARVLLERYGVVAREHARHEGVPGGWSALYAVLSVMEHAGQVRRGWFVDGLGGAQFALPGAVERLRAARGAADGPRWLTATDPAQLYGGVLPWPAVSGSARPRRVGGARVALAGGAPVAWLNTAGALVLFQGVGDDALAAVVEALRADLGYRTLRVDRVDGAPALASDRLGALLAAGFKRDLKGLILTR